MTKTHSQLIAYRSDDENFGILRVPKEGKAHPIIVLVHGGMWRAMYDLDYFNPIASALTDAGIATRNIEYRRLGKDGDALAIHYRHILESLDKSGGMQGVVFRKSQN